MRFGFKWPEDLIEKDLPLQRLVLSRLPSWGGAKMSCLPLSSFQSRLGLPWAVECTVRPGPHRAPSVLWVFIGSVSVTLYM